MNFITHAARPRFMEVTPIMARDETSRGHAYHSVSRQDHIVRHETPRRPLRSEDLSVGVSELIELSVCVHSPTCFVELDSHGHDAYKKLFPSLNISPYLSPHCMELIGIVYDLPILRRIQSVLGFRGPSGNRVFHSGNAQD